MKKRCLIPLWMMMYATQDFCHLRLSQSCERYLLLVYCISGDILWEIILCVSCLYGQVLGNTVYSPLKLASFAALEKKPGEEIRWRRERCWRCEEAAILQSKSYKSACILIMCSILDVYSVCTLWLTAFICGSLHLQHINWDKLYKKELEPPFVPTVVRGIK